MRSTLIRSCANRVVAMGNKYAGFTLIELCIVMAIVAILAALATPSFLLPMLRNKCRRRSRIPLPFGRTWQPL